MKKRREITQAAFEELLGWLDPDPGAAGEKYEYIRLRLIRIFTGRGCRVAEELADETIDRVALKVREVAQNYGGDPANYFYGVAYKVLHEYQRKKPPPGGDLPDIAAPDVDDGDADAYECLDSCLRALLPKHRDLVLQYYRESGQHKFTHRRELAEKLGIPMNALRIRVFRIRTTLQQCVVKCLERGQGV